MKKSTQTEIKMIKQYMEDIDYLINNYEIEVGDSLEKHSELFDVIRKFHHLLFDVIDIPKEEWIKWN